MVTPEPLLIADVFQREVSKTKSPAPPTMILKGESGVVERWGQPDPIPVFFFHGADMAMPAGSWQAGHPGAADLMRAWAQGQVRGLFRHPEPSASRVPPRSGTANISWCRRAAPEPSV